MIDRFIFNFRNKCNMSCSFCYIPFVDNHYGSLKLWKEIIDFMSFYNPQIITFGGGDPFIYRDFIKLIKYCKDAMNVSIHVDTNGMLLNEEHFEFILNNIDVLGLPLDGLEPMNTMLRNNKSHFQKVLKHLDFFKENNYKVKMNSVITNLNYLDLIRLVDILNRYDLSIWYLYEYWHFTEINSPEYSINTYDLVYTVNQIKKKSKNPVRYSSVNDRSKSYIFISSMGKVYNINHLNQYIELGDIKDKRIHNIIEESINLTAISNRCNEKLL